MHLPPLRWRPYADRFARLAARGLERRAVEAQNERAIVSFTFDDIDATAATTGAEILERHGARGTFYVAGSLCERSAGKGPFASLEACRDLARRGHEIACHTYTHVPVRQLSETALLADVARNAAYLTDKESAPALESFAFPFNAPTLAAKRALSQRFSTGRGGVPGVNSGSVDFAFLKAVEINDTDLAPAGMRAWIDEALRHTGWLIFFTHDVKPGPSRHGTTPELLEAAVTLARGSGAEVLTVREAAVRVRGAQHP